MVPVHRLPLPVKLIFQAQALTNCQWVNSRERLGWPIQLAPPYSPAGSSCGGRVLVVIGYLAGGWLSNVDTCGHVARKSPLLP